MGGEKSGHATAEYRAWHGMKTRCTNSRRPDWKNYGGRGITICERWANSFEAFLADMGRKPSRWHTLDRIDNDRGYSPENCRWTTWDQQSANKRQPSRRQPGLVGIRKFSVPISEQLRAVVLREAEKTDRSLAAQVRVIISDWAAGRAAAPGNHAT